MTFKSRLADKIILFDFGRFSDCKNPGVEERHFHMAFSALKNVSDVLVQIEPHPGTNLGNMSWDSHSLKHDSR